VNKLFWEVSDTEREAGYCLRDDKYHCLLCGFQTEAGYIYPQGSLLVDAEKQMQIHIAKSHKSVFSFLSQLDKKLTGLSEHQRKILRLFQEGKSDYQVQQELGIKSKSTIRNHRYNLREKEKQAKVFCTLMSLYSKIDPQSVEVIKPHKTAVMVDDRYNITREEYQNTIERYFPEGSDGPLKTFSVKEKSKIIILREIVKRFEKNRQYTHLEVNEILKKVYAKDFVLIRRYLIQYGFLDRHRDGSAYWVKQERVNMEKEQFAQTRKEMRQNYKEKIENEKVFSGVYQIKNLVNEKIYLGASRQIKNFNKQIFLLNTGSFRNQELVKDWQEFGADSFEIKVLESFEEDGDFVGTTKKLKQMLNAWKSKLQPYGNQGYHRAPK